jgi:hypothetical protein
MVVIMFLLIKGTVVRILGGPFTSEKIEGMSIFSQAAAYVAIASWTVGAIAVAVFFLVALGAAAEKLHLLVKKFGAIRLHLPWGL